MKDRRLVETLRGAGADLARLLVPVACPGCGVEDLILCDACAALWWEPPRRSEDCAPRLDVDGGVPLPVWSIATHEGPVAAMVTGWKDGGRRDLDRTLAAAAERAARHIGPALRDVCAARIAVVPAPARPASTRRRGVDLPATLARAAAAGLGERAARERVLRIGAGESRGASARGRWRAARGSVHCRRAPRAPALIVDDVLTTGATLAACAAALEERGTPVLGALTLTVGDSGRVRAPGRLV